MKATANLNSKIRQTEGFTLLEVMVALAIVAIALVTLLSLANRSVTISGYLQHMTQATLLAQEKMSEIESGVIDAGLGLDRLEGAFDPPFDQFQWRTETEETPLGSVLMLTVVVFWGDEKKNESVDLSSFVFTK